MHSTSGSGHLVFMECINYKYIKTFWPLSTYTEPMVIKFGKMMNSRTYSFKLLIMCIEQQTLKIKRI